MTDPGSDRLTETQRERMADIRSAETLEALVGLMGADSAHDAYLQAKAEWRYLRGRELGPPGDGDDLPGNRVLVDGQPFHVHGITHANTDPERAVLRRRVASILDAGGAVYCEQGVRPMYFADMDAVCETDDYRWALSHCRKQGFDSHIEATLPSFDTEDEVPGVRSVVSRLREMTFSLIDSGSEVYGDRFASALGDIASTFLMSHEELATGEDFASFQKSRIAAADPDQLAALQRYYERSFLPQPLEREWLRRHNPEIELFTHARNERITAYVLAHVTDPGPVHIILGAAHQPGVSYYLAAYRDGGWSPGPFEPVR